jgi:CRISPR-associated protein Cmr5
MNHTLDQIRSANALQAVTDGNQTFIGKNRGDIVKKLPQLIMTNGLLQVLAFAKKEGDTSGYGKAMMAVATHLADPRVRVLTSRPDNLEDLAKIISNADARILRLATAEALAYLNYLKRYAS